MVYSLVGVKSAAMCNGMSQHASLQHVHWRDHLKGKREEECLETTYLGRPLPLPLPMREIHSGRMLILPTVKRTFKFCLNISKIHLTSDSIFMPITNQLN